jgi:hypothetical protein
MTKIVFRFFWRRFQQMIDGIEEAMDSVWDDDE